MSVTQEAFHSAIFDPAKPAPIGLTGPYDKQAGKRFDVYRNNVAVGLSDALETAFPVVRKLLGDKFYRAMAGVYLRKYPPTSPMMMFYGMQMPEFLRSFGPVMHLHYLPDIARIEIAQRCSYHAADAAPIDPYILGEFAADQLYSARFRFAPAIHLIQSDFPIHQIWMANVAPDASQITVPAASDILITRPKFDPVVHPLSRAASRAMQALLQGQSLGDSVAAGGASFDIAALLSLLLAQHAIVTID